MFARIIITLGLVSTGLLLIVMSFTTPSSAGAMGILSIFVLGYVSLLSLVTFALWATAKVANKVGGDLHLRKKNQELSFKSAYYYASVLALGPIIIISLQSVGVVGVYELGLVGLFMVLGCIYIAKRTT